MFSDYLILLLSTIYLLLDLSTVIAYDLSDELCDRKTNCIALNNARCLDITFSYKYSKLNGLLQDFNFNTESEIHDYLDKWTGLKSVPRCWASIQPLLCTAFFPRCDEEKVSLLSLPICKNVKANFKILDQYISENSIKNIPSFLNCNDTNLYQPKCRTEYADIKFNSSAARCRTPLISTDDSNIYYRNIEGCALDCDDPLYNRIDKIAFQIFIITASCISLIVVLISMLSYLPKWSNLELTSKICFYIQVCFMIHYTGWLMQALINKKLIACKSDQTLKYSEPNGNGLSCLIDFILIYYSAFSILSWYVIMAVTTLNKEFKPNLYKNSSLMLYLHLCAWSSSFLFTIMAIAFSQIDGNFVYGICFISFSNKFAGYLFVFIPLTIGCSIYICGMIYRAIPVRSMLQSSEQRGNLINRKKYKKTFMKLVISSFVMFIVLIFSHIVFFSKNYDLSELSQSLNKEILCQLNLNSVFGLNKICHHSTCDDTVRRSLTLDYWIMIFVFGSGVCSSFWNFDLLTIVAWILEIIREFNNTARSEKLLLNKQDPVKINCETITTTPISNNINHINQHHSKTNESNQLTNSKRLGPKNQLAKNIGKFEISNKSEKNCVKRVELENQQHSFNQHQNANLLRVNHETTNNMNILPVHHMSNNLMPNNMPINLYSNIPNHFSNNLPSESANQYERTNGFANIAKLNELKRKENASVFLTHGMSDQKKVNHIMNPFNEKRRPDSNLEMHQTPNDKNQPTNENLQQATLPTIDQLDQKNIQNSYIVQNANLIQQDMQSNSFQPLALNQTTMDSFLLNPTAYPTLFPVFPADSQYYITQNYRQLQSEHNLRKFNDFMYQSFANLTAARNMTDVELKKREISETIHITQTVESASEANESYLPIQIHDSDISSLCSVDSRLGMRMDVTNGEQIPSDLKDVYAKLKTLDDSMGETKKEQKS